MSTYTKPSNLTYTDLCIYFDNNIYKKDRNDFLLFEYLYHIVLMLASKARYFRDFEDYDEFAIFGATRVFLRYPHVDKIDTYDETKKIKSVLNYTKATLYPMKVDYQRENFAQVFNYNNEDRYEDFINNTKTTIQTDYAIDLYDTLLDTIKKLPNVIRGIIKESPYRNDKLMSERLYMSCLLSFINSMTVDNQKLQQISRRADANEREELRLDAMKRARSESVILWRLDDTMINYVTVLVNKVRNTMNQDLTSTKNSFNLTESELDGVMMTAFSSTGNISELSEKDD